jgi:hypothetical protein
MRRKVFAFPALEYMAQEGTDTHVQKLHTASRTFAGPTGIRSMLCRCRFSVVLALVVAIPAMATTYTDGFEAPTINPFWTLTGPGTATLTQAVAYSGVQSVQLTAAPTFPWDINLIHSFGSQLSGSISVRVKGDQLCCGSGAALQIGNMPLNWTGLIQQSGNVNNNCNTCFTACRVLPASEGSLSVGPIPL